MTTLRWQEERDALHRVCQRLVKTGMVTGSSGNVSARLKNSPEDLVLITARGIELEELTPRSLSVIDLNGEPVEEDLPPSSESALHLSIYRSRPNVGSVVHSHPIFSTVAAVSGREIPPIVDEVVIKIGGAVQVAEYAFPGTEELAEKALSALGNRMAVLLRNHGLITVGRTPEEALENSILVERLAQIFMYTTLTGGVKPLPREIVELEEELYLMKISVESAGGGSNGNDT